MQLLALGESVADFEYAVVRESDDVACPSLIDGTLTLRHELGRRGETYGLAHTDVQVRLVTLELTGAYLAECDTRTVVGVDVCGNLEDETRELLLVRFYHTLFRFCRAWGRSNLDEAIEEFLHTKVVECRAEEYWCHFCRAVCLHVEFWIYTVNELKVIAQLLCIVFANLRVEVRGIDINGNLLGDTLFVWREEVELLFVDIVNALELGSLVDWP